jgi:UDPglucose 6-dehydrogenase
MGKLGIPIAAVFASKGYRVLGVDTDPARVAAINAGRPPVFEPGLEDLLSATRGRFVATEDCESAVSSAEITFIVVPTPSEADGGFSLRHVLAACGGIGAALREKAAYHLVVLTSTVLPGDTSREIRPRLDARSGKRCGVDFGLCYNPEFVALGSVIRNVLNPDFILIGESDSRAGDRLAAFYGTVCENRPAVARMSPVNAELTKLAVNTFVTTKITFANMLARLCERLPGGNVDEVTAALGLDSRIGRKYLQGAIGYGGPCFPRDNLAMSCLARRHGVPALLAEATHASNRQQVPLLKGLVLSRVPAGGQVGILGLAYKPNTDVVEESQGLDLARSLLAEAIRVLVYDPAAMENARQILGDGVRYASSAEACAQEADVLVIATPWEEFARVRPEVLARPGRRPVVVDCWRTLTRAQLEGVAEYLALGVGAAGHDGIAVPEF